MLLIGCNLAAENLVSCSALEVYSRSLESGFGFSPPDTKSDNKYTAACYAQIKTTWCDRFALDTFPG